MKNNNPTEFPDIELDFAYKNKLFSASSKKNAQGIFDLATKGYTIYPLESIDKKFVEKLKQKVQDNLTKGLSNFQDKIYQYSEAPRVFEEWKINEYAARLTTCPEILTFLKDAYGYNPTPFQSINFIKSSSQPTHSDAIHFNTQPGLWMVGVWIAFEPVSKKNGTLYVYDNPAKSTVNNLLDFEDFGIEVPKYGQQAKSYSEYEKALDNLISLQGLKRNEINLDDKLYAVIWRANTLHGGLTPQHSSLTRWSQATHYYFEKPGLIPYCPMFSSKSKGTISLKTMHDKNISVYAKSRGWTW